MEKRLLQIILGIFILGFIWNKWDPLWRFDLNEAANPHDNEKITFEVKKGAYATSIAKDLNEAGLIIDEKSFLKALNEEDLESSLQYGSYRLSPSMTLREVISTLTSEGTGEMVVRLIEGWNISEIDDYLFELGLIQDGDFELCVENCKFDYDFLKGASGLEGYLFPDTYFIDESTFSVEKFINQLLSNFESKLSDEMKYAIEESGRSLDEVVIVASMLEKEVFTEKDIPIVAGIIWKRLDNNWTLGIDATLLYVQEDNVLTAEDLAMDSPYNTRIETGLPPSSISNPGLASLKGAIFPEESEYWFYLTKADTGEVIYARNNEEHEANKEKYL